MSVQPLQPGKLPHRSAFTDYGVQIEPIGSPILRWVLYGLPWVILIALLVEILSSNDPMFFSGQFAAVLALFAFQMLMQHIPETFDVLWSRNIIVLKPETRTSSEEETGDSKPAAPNAKSSTLVQHYASYLKGVESSLNHPGGLILGLVFAGLGMARFPYETGGLGEFLRLYPQASWDYQLEVVFEGLIGFVLGLMAWRMLFTALQVSELDNLFDLEVQFDHPDGAGGLEPLGNLCLWNALILTIPAAYFAAWMILGPRSIYGNAYTDLFTKLLLVPILLTPVTFILPLWSIHRLMAAKAVTLRRDLDELGESINRLARQILNQADTLDPDDAQKKVKSLELMQQVYQDSRNIPVWPLNVTILTKFGTAQIVPLLGLTGLGQPLLKVVDSLVKFIGQ
jgi:hypothetical protein